jgi:hypothetical protein
LGPFDRLYCARGPFQVQNLRMVEGLRGGSKRLASLRRLGPRKLVHGPGSEDQPAAVLDARTSSSLGRWPRDAAITR